VEYIIVDVGALLTFDDANWVGGGRGEIDVRGGDFKGFL
jgi:hypothetical protein